MMRLIRWLAVLVVVYFGVTEFLPWIRHRVEGVSQEKIVGKAPAADAGAVACVRLALEASDLVVDESRNAVPPPGDSTGWVEAGPSIQRQIAQAEDACTCDAPACRTALEALREVSAQVQDLDLLIAGQERFAGALAHRQERIGELLEQARVLVR
jgi:hypothetical protein